IVMAAKVYGGFGHALVIHGLEDNGGPLIGESRGRRPIEDEIAVGSRLSRIARVGMQGNRTSPHQADGAREHRSCSHDPTAHGAGYVGIEVGDLPACVDASVCAASADDLNRFSRYATQSTLNEALNGPQRLLRLPT